MSQFLRVFCWVIACICTTWTNVEPQTEWLPRVPRRFLACAVGPPSEEHWDATKFNNPEIPEITVGRPPQENDTMGTDGDAEEHETQACHFLPIAWDWSDATNTRLIAVLLDAFADRVAGAGENSKWRVQGAVMNIHLTASFHFRMDDSDLLIGFLLPSVHADLEEKLSLPLRFSIYPCVGMAYPHNAVVPGPRDVIWQVTYHPENPHWDTHFG